MSKSKDVARPTGTEIVTADEAFSSMHLLGAYEVVGYKAVTRPVLRQADDVPFWIKIISKIVTAEKIEGSAMDPPDFFFAVNLETGEEVTVIANAAMASALERTYPGDDYVGKSFAMISRLRKHKENRTIREYLIKELILKD